MENITIKIRDQYQNRFQLTMGIAKEVLKRVMMILPVALIAIFLKDFNKASSNSIMISDLFLYIIPVFALLILIIAFLGASIQCSYLWHTTIYLRKDAIYLIRNVSNKFIRGGFRVPYPYIQFILESEDSLAPYFSRSSRNAQGIDIPVRNSSNKLRLKSFFNQVIGAQESIIIPSSGLIKPKHIRERFKILPKKESLLWSRKCPRT